MTTRRDDIPEFALEASTEEKSAVQLQELSDTLVKMGSVLPIEPPPMALRARLLTTAASANERYAPFFDKLSSFLDLGVERLKAIFTEAEDPARWRTEPSLGLGLFDFDGGPALVGVDTGLVRVDAGCPFPEHRHLGRERVLLLEGAYRDSSGVIYRAGDLHEMAAGTTHSYVVLPDGPCLMALALEGGGVDINGTIVSV